MVRFYNSLTRHIDEFHPISEDHVGYYTCGPTVHDFAHIGNFRTFAWEDLLRRHLEYRGYNVVHVMNITDVEDKIIRKAREAGVSIGEWTARYTEAFFEDSRALHLRPAHHYPRATEHVEQMLDLVRRLEERGHTYVSEASVYYRISSFEGYGKLVGLDRDRLALDLRVDADEYDKDDPADFVLWKGAKSGEPAWESPWGKGRPGWHLECSAMSLDYLGETFDIHAGGVDLKFPHHDNEIAQSEGATGKRFVNYWLHGAHLLADEEKMSKSLGNFHTLRDLLEKGQDPRVLRYLLIGTHYRKTLNFTFEALDQARSELERIDALRQRLGGEVTEKAGGVRIASRLDETRQAFGEALDDDLNISGAMGEVFRLVRELNRAIDKGEIAVEDAEAAESLFAEVDAVVGSLLPWEASGDEVDMEILEMVEQREQARAGKDWAAADRLRDEIISRGYEIEDTPQGARVKRCR